MREYTIDQQGQVSVVRDDDGSDAPAQCTNCLDGILRDSHGNPIELDKNDFSHQSYSAEDSDDGSKITVRYVFRDGRLTEQN